MSEMIHTQPLICLFVYPKWVVHWISFTVGSEFQWRPVFKWPKSVKWLSLNSIQNLCFWLVLNGDTNPRPKMSQISHVLLPFQTRMIKVWYSDESSVWGLNNGNIWIRNFYISGVQMSGIQMAVRYLDHHLTKLSN